MKNRDLALKSFLSSFGVLVYIGIVAVVLSNAERVFDHVSSLFIPVFLLLFFVVSACITGALVLGYPIFLFLNNQKTQAIKLFLAELAWLFTYILIIVGFLLLK